MLGQLKRELLPFLCVEDICKLFFFFFNNSTTTSAPFVLRALFLRRPRRQVLVLPAKEVVKDEAITTPRIV